VIYEGQIVGRLIEGDGKKLTGKKIDQDGEVVDKGKSSLLFENEMELLRLVESGFPTFSMNLTNSFNSWQRAR
jgi:Protein of unknown function (DUF3659)